MIKTTAAAAADDVFRNNNNIKRATRTHTSRHNGPRLSSTTAPLESHNIIIYNARALALINRLAAGAMLDCARTASSSSRGHDPSCGNNRRGI